MQFLRIYSHPLATLSTGTPAERQAQLAFGHSEVLGVACWGRKTT